MLPWVSRGKLASVRKLFHMEQAASLQLRIQNAELMGRNAELSESLKRSERERVDLQTKLLRVSFGINPFAELIQAPAAAEQAQQANDFSLRPDMSDEEIQKTFTAEAMQLYGGNLAKVTRFVQARMDEFYQHRDRPPVLTDAERQRAAAVAADLEAAIREGRARAAAEV